MFVSETKFSGAPVLYVAYAEVDSLVSEYDVDCTVNLGMYNDNIHHCSVFMRCVVDGKIIHKRTPVASFEAASDEFIQILKNLEFTGSIRYAEYTLKERSYQMWLTVHNRFKGVKFF
jgi:hypothetical protein